MYFVPWREPAQGCQRDPYPLLVEKWRWLDDVTAEFTLRPGVRFHNKPPVNGRELVAADFSAFFEERYRKFSQPENKTRLVKSVSVTSKHVFEMKMVGPWGGLISDLFTSSYGPWVEAKEAGGREGELWGNPEKAWIGVGPFMFERWMPAVKAALVRNPDYWVKGLPYLDRVEVLVIPDVSTRFAALVSGKLDMSKELPEEIMAVGERLIPGLQVVRCPGDSVGKQGVLSMGTNAPPFNDVRVRRAISMAINRQFILDGFYLGRGTYPHVTSPSMLYGLRLEDFPRELRQYFEFNPDRARQLLAEAGYPNGFATTIHAWRGVGSPHDLIVEAVAAQLVEVGIKAKLDFMERGAYTAVVFPGKYPDGDMAVHAGLVATPEEAHALSAMWSKGGRNISRINSPEYDRLFERYVVTVDEGQRLELARQLQIMAAENMWRVMLYIPDAVLAVRPGIHFTWLGGGTSTDMSMTLRSAWRE